MNSRRRTVLLVDDDLDVCEAYAEVLGEAGYEVWSAHNGVEALALLREVPTTPHVILVDQMMPLMDGSELRRELSRFERFSAVPVILMTAGRQPPSGQVAAYLQKPVSLERLLDLVGRLVSAGGAS